MEKIRCKTGEMVLVDDEDFVVLNHYLWNYKERWGKGYAIRYGFCPVRYKYSSFLMHRVIMKLPFDNKQIVDHIDGNGLNNQKSNLRLCTQQQNIQNKKPHKNCVSKYKGVSYCSTEKRRKNH